MDQTSSASKPGTSKQPENLEPTAQRTQSSSQADEAMDVDLYGPSFPPHVGGKQSLGSQFNIQLQQQMGVFQASMLEAMKSL